MAAMSDYLENKFLDHFLGTSSTSAPATVYVALFTSDPADDASGTEVSGSGYARQSIAFGAASSASASNSGAVTFPAASGGAWGSITHLAIFDASTSGNLLFHSSLSTSKTISDGDIFKINASGVTITAA